MQFKNKYSFVEREEEALKIKKIYSDRIPVIVERSQGCKNIPDIDKNKYLVPHDLTIGQLLYIIRRRIKLDAHQSMFIFINNTIPTTSEYICNIYERSKDKDNFLYITYAGENTFG